MQQSSSDRDWASSELLEVLPEHAAFSDADLRSIRLVCKAWHRSLSLAETVTLNSIAELQAVARYWNRFPRLENITFGSVDGQPIDSSTLDALKGIKLTSATFEDVITLGLLAPSLPHLTSLDLEHLDDQAVLPNGDTPFSILKRMTSLRHLEFTTTDHLADLRELTQLTGLHLHMLAPDDISVVQRDSSGMSCVLRGILDRVPASLTHCDISVKELQVWHDDEAGEDEEEDDAKAIEIAQLEGSYVSKVWAPTSYTVQFTSTNTGLVDVENVIKALDSNGARSLQKLTVECYIQDAGSVESIIVHYPSLPHLQDFKLTLSGDPEAKESCLPVRWHEACTPCDMVTSLMVELPRNTCRDAATDSQFVSDIPRLFPGLTSLTFSAPSDHFLHCFRPLCQLSELTSLHLWAKQYSERSFAKNLVDVAGVVTSSPLRSLHLKGFDIEDESPHLFHGLTALTSLTLSDGPLCDLSQLPSTLKHVSIEAALSFGCGQSASQ